ncbi:hypothetical protein B5F07_04585 [Lachnoclostridium sp. An169]|uniref:alpha/beta hydrolase n=1 Tax=Lachnoclostridium sp. An169 TaxID=1965569 RepID=UPI000B387984|nr:alpha/beta hydrolase [Lachnoclostridium sp. An169]OUP85426.1 hypothetical protein B5F07_04585 [Lachnoclostridium sp. An169]HJA67899.1 alpha/beta hydrolase [Candidatus Mediterraneibacter cottocaccae]
MSLQSVLFRTICTFADAARDKGLRTPPDIRRIDNIPYGPEGAWNTLDIYRPKSVPGKLPVLVSVHGGGYVYGSTKQYQFYCMNLAQKGFAVVSFNYRLAPEYKFPAPLEDLNQVMWWIADKAGIYGLDTERAALVGDSAGAQIASQYAAVCTNPEYAEVMGIFPPSVKICALGLNCGMYDLKAQALHEEMNGLKKSDYFGTDPQQFGEKLNVLDAVTPVYPPAYLLSSGGDFLRDKCEPMAEFLRKKGIPCEYKIYGDENTGHVFHLNIRSELAERANDDEIRFIKKYL